MGLSDLFKSTKEIEREKRKELRSKEREAERGISRLARDVRKLEKSRAVVWVRARELLQAGRRDEAARLLNQYKMMGVQINNLEKQRMLAQNKLTNVSAAGTLGMITGAIAGYAEGMDIDPDKVGENIDAISNVEGEIEEVNNIVKEAYESDMQKASEASEEQDGEVTDEELMAELESEAVGEIGVSGRMANSVSGGMDDINAGRDRLRNLLDETGNGQK